jgi:hypothetical protein
MSTLILGNNIQSTAKTSLDVNGSYRTRVQTISTTGNTISVNGGNLVFFSSATNSVLYLPITNAVETGMLYTMHSEATGNLFLSTLGGDTLNGGTTPLTIGKNRSLTSIMCLGSGEWHAIISA